MKPLFFVLYATIAQHGQLTTEATDVFQTKAECEAKREWREAGERALHEDPALSAADFGTAVFYCAAVDKLRKAS